MAERTRERKAWLEDRPAAANRRSEIGHWERDLLLGKRGRSALLTMIDRRSRYVLVRHVKRVNARRVATATRRALKRFRGITKTVTNDNGVEFQKEKLQAAIGVPIYFTNPGKPWERGSIENANGLIRQYLRKGFNMDNLNPCGTRALEETLNFRPRRILGWKTPHEVFFGKRVSLTKGDMLRFGIEISRVN
jgi:IS30 family transposase